MKVYDTDQPFVFEVESSTPGKRYTVHALFNRGDDGVPRGLCNCPAHAFRCQAAIYRNEPALSKGATCKHIYAVRDHLYLAVVTDRAKHQ